MTTETKKSDGVEIEYYYSGVRLSNDGKGEFIATFEIVDKTLAVGGVEDELAFTVPLKRVTGAQIGAAYSITYKGGTKYAFPVGGKWYAARVEGKVKSESIRATWQIQDQSAKQEKAAMKWAPDDAVDRAMTPLLMIYYRLSAAERASFETMIIRTLRKKATRLGA